MVIRNQISVSTTSDIPVILNSSYTFIKPDSSTTVLTMDMQVFRTSGDFPPATNSLQCYLTVFRIA